MQSDLSLKERKGHNYTNIMKVCVLYKGIATVIMCIIKLTLNLLFVMSLSIKSRMTSLTMKKQIKNLLRFHTAPRRAIIQETLR